MMTTETSVYDDYEDDDSYIPMTLPLQIVSGTLIAVLIVLVVGGNALTIISYLKDDKLTSVYDFYIFNLAIADFFIGCVSLPFYSVYTLMEFTWVFGRAFCKIWSTIDFTCCLESVLIMLILSLDRLLLITYGPFYTTKVTKQKAYLTAVCSWLLAFLVYSPSIIGWDYWVGYSSVEDMDCDVEFSNNFEFTTCTAVLEFVIPFVLLAVLNILIYLKIRTKTRTELSRTTRHQPSASQMSEIADDRSTEIMEAECTIASGVNANVKCDSSTTVAVINESIEETPGGVNLGKRCKKTSTEIQPEKDKRMTRKASEKFVPRTSRDIKAARFLATLIVVFFVTWVPYTITTIVISFCDPCVNTSTYQILTWLLWIKSAVNPFLYAANSARYRHNFRKYMSCRSNLVAPAY